LGKADAQDAAEATLYNVSVCQCQCQSWIYIAHRHEGAAMRYLRY